MNNKAAADPTWQQLMAFLTKDSTDRKRYDAASFACGAFAEEVHNNGEAAGIKAAWVAIDFKDVAEGHGLNAFTTSDKGLVFIDCTGEGWSRMSFRQSPPGGGGNFGVAGSWDKIAYVSAEKELGLVSVSVATSPDYSSYLRYCEQRNRFLSALEAYNKEVVQFNQWLAGRTIYAGSAEELKAIQWEQKLKSLNAELETLSKSLGALWEPLGTVSKVKIYW